MSNKDGKRLRGFMLLALCACMAVSPLYSASDGGSSAGDPSSGIVRAAPDRDSRSAQTEFAVKLFKENCRSSEGNVCIAPMSLYSALAMTQNGAAGTTLDEMGALLGGSADNINAYMSWYADSLKDDGQLRSANSIWMTDNEKLFVPDEKFLGTVRDGYSSDVFTRPFPPEDSSETVKDINRWVKKSTDGMIEELVSEIPDETVMYLINTAAFDAEWERKYTPDKVRPGYFTAADGSEQECEMMNSSERLYISDGMASGFIKPYKNGRYSFAAILPNEDVTLDEYISALTAKSFADLITSAEGASVSASVPKFSMSYEQEQSDVLKTLGMVEAFSDAKADFSAMGTCPPDYVIFVNRVLHKTYIAVDEEGTRAAAASAAEMGARMTAMMEEHYVRLDRPFMYAIIDNQTGSPVFMGAVSSLK